MPEHQYCIANKYTAGRKITAFHTLLTLFLSTNRVFGPGTNTIKWPQPDRSSNSEPRIQRTHYLFNYLSIMRD